MEQQALKIVSNCLNTNNYSFLEFLKVFILLKCRHTIQKHSMEQHALKNVNNFLNTNNYSYLETSGG